MGLFSGFKKKKQSDVGARESKRDQRAEDRRIAERSAGKGEDGAQEAKKQARTKVVGTLPASLENVLIRPRLTEKGGDLAGMVNAYVFDVHKHATKPEIAKAVRALYKVDPIKVRIVKVPGKVVRGRRGQQGFRSGGKKAYVFLKQGDTIEFV